LLLLYFIVALGIRLDDISRAIGGSGGNPESSAGAGKPRRPAARDPLAVASNQTSLDKPSAETMPMSVENYRSSEPP